MKVLTKTPVPGPLYIDASALIETLTFRKKGAIYWTPFSRAGKIW